MGRALEVTDTFNTFGAANANFVANTAFPGDTLSIRSFPSTENAYIVDLWGVAATENQQRLRSPRFHDNVNGILVRPFTVSRSLLTEWQWQKVYPQDTLIAEMTGAAIETDGFGYLTYYPDLPGADARLVDFDSIKPRIVNLVNVTVANAAGAAVGARSASRAINADSDLLVANTDYALLGYECDAAGLSIGIRGPDTGNLRVGGPATTERVETRDYFTRLGKQQGIPTIPVINSANKAGTLVDNAQVVAGVAMNVTLLFAELSA